MNYKKKKDKEIRKIYEDDSFSRIIIFFVNLVYLDLI